MKIKRSVWHYKISNLWRDCERSNDNLCRYFWGLAGKCVVLFIGIPICIFLAGTLTYFYFTDPMWIARTIILLFICFSTIFPPVVICFVRKKFGKSPKMPYQNIVIEYIKAKKERICPLIEYID